jgi:hypothetical protein
MPTLIYKNEQQSGPFEDEELRAALQSGTYSLDDLGWQEGMAEWQPLRTFFLSSASATQAPPPPRAEPPIPICFGTGTKVDGFGFVRQGTITLKGSQVEIVGPRHWHFTIRIVAFVIGFIIMCMVAQAILNIAHAIGGTAASGYGFIFGNPITAAVFTLWAVHTFCASRASLLLDRTAIQSVQRSKTLVTFKAPDQRGKIRKSVVRTESVQSATQLEQVLRNL